MSRKRRQKDKTKQKQALPALPRIKLPDLAVLRPIGTAVALIVVVAASVWGLEEIKERVHSRPEYVAKAGEIQLELDLDSEQAWVAGEKWRPLILKSFTLPEDAGWMDETLLKRVAEQLQASGWVSRVNQVVRELNYDETAGELHRTIRVDCDFRRPVAMVLNDEVCLAVDKDGYRLPGEYKYVSGSGWIRIVGVEAEAPDVGARYESEDALAGIQLAALLSEQPFWNKIQTVDVRNFGGRLSRLEPPIRVIHLNGGGFLWGSPLGDEHEEATPEEKLRSIAYQLRSDNPDDWPKGMRDVSVYPNAWIADSGDVVRTADGSRSR